MSAEPYGRADVVGLQVGLAGSSEPLSRLVSFSRAIASEQVPQRMLRIATRHLTMLLSAKACLVSQVEDGLLREVADYAHTTRQVARGLSYYLTDYPTTASVLMTGKPLSRPCRKIAAALSRSLHSSGLSLSIRLVPRASSRSHRSPISCLLK